MGDFTSGFWEIYISVLTIVSILACAVFLKSQTRAPVPGKVGTTGHVWDEDLAEWNNPLPNWWRWLFYITIVFSLVYVVLYPGLGIFRGVLGWTQVGQYEQEQKRAEAAYGPIYAKYAGMEIEQVAADPAAMAIGQNLYLNYCAQCHASDARGSKGFPNLADGDWLWGGDPKQIKETILAGRNGVMPPFGAALGAEGTKDVAHFVLSLSGAPSDSIRVARGKDKFMQTCAACHGPEGKGNQALGAPNLTDKVWLHGTGEGAIIETINQGRNNVMPAWKEFLGEQKIHVLTAYIWGLSNKSGAK
ncbi:MAG: cytochrome-c oxidase, cbb3-type subunit III [Anaerolineae bacterium]|jgi:cytochrome c oxidase cbb3-type subunit 3|nr:cytochrome-c oxidase, cbb3-type subunit III [Anaerolineae bacterium]